MHARLTTPELQPFAALLADCPELLRKLDAWLPTGSGLLAAIPPFVLLLGMLKAAYRQAAPTWCPRHDRWPVGSCCAPLQEGAHSRC